MPDRVLLVISDGIGNILQWLPLVATLQKVKGWHIDIAFESPNYPIPSSLFPGLRASLLSDFRIQNYSGVIVDGRAQDHLLSRGEWHSRFDGINILNDPRKQLINAQRPFVRSEVDVRLDVARELGIPDSKFEFYFHLETPQPLEFFDVVMINGYNTKSKEQWGLKQYPQMSCVAEKLLNLGYSVCCLGEHNQTIGCCTDRTGLLLEQSLAILREASLVISTDTGLYHAANLFMIPNIVIFTFTSDIKNYDYRFHQFSTVIKNNNVACRDVCQDKILWKRCCTPDCQNIDPNRILEQARFLLGESK